MRNKKKFKKFIPIFMHLSVIMVMLYYIYRKFLILFSVHFFCLLANKYFGFSNLIQLNMQKSFSPIYKKNNNGWKIFLILRIQRGVKSKNQEFLALLSLFLFRFKMNYFSTKICTQKLFFTIAYTNQKINKIK